MRLSAVLVSFFTFPLCASLLGAAPAKDLKDYLNQALPTQTIQGLDTRSHAILFKEVELRVGADDEDFKSAKFRVSPYAWNERGHQQELTKLEADLYQAQIEEQASLRSFEISKLIIALYAHEQKLLLLKKISALSDRLVSAFEKNFSLLSEKPEDYIKLMEDRLLAQEGILEHESLVRQSRVSLAKAAGLSLDEFQLNLDQLIDADGIRSKIKSWPLENPSPSLKNMNLQLNKAELETVIINDRKGFVLNYFDLGTSLKKDGSPDQLDFGVGVSIPLFSGEYKAKEFELQSKKLKVATDLEMARLQEKILAEDLRSRVLFRVDHAKDLASKDLESTLNRIQKRTREQLGPGSLQALNVELAFEKLRLRKLESMIPAWEEFLELAQLTGQLDPNGQLLLSEQASSPKVGG